MLLALGVVVAQEARLAQVPSGFVATGIHGQDEANIAALVGACLGPDGGLSYPNPYATSIDAPASFSQLIYIVLAVLTWVCGSFPAGYTVTLLLGGALAYAALYDLLGAAKLEGRARRWVFLFLALGGGWAWFLSVGCWGVDGIARAATGSNLMAPLLLSGTELSGSDVIRAGAHSVQRYWLMWGHPFFWWRMSNAQVFFAPYDLLNHALFFFTLAQVLRGRLVWAGCLTALALWAHPFTGAHLAATVVVFGGLEALRAESPADRRPALLLAAAAAGCVAVALGYYVWLGRQPQGFSTAAAGASLVHNMPLRGVLGTFGPALAVLAFGVWCAGARALVERDRVTRVLFAWALVSILLVWVQSWFTVRFQPLHYARGLLFSSLVLLGVTLALGASPAAEEETSSPPEQDPAPVEAVRRAWPAWALAVALLLSAGDNLCFAYQYTTQPWHTTFSLRVDQRAVIDRLAALPEREVVLTVPEGLPVQTGKAVAVLTHHVACLGDPYWVADHQERRALLLSYARNPQPELPRQLGATVLVLPEAVWRRAGRPKAFAVAGGYRLVRAAR